MNEPRFVVVESEGYAISPGATQAGHAATVLTVCVLDSAYCYREIARYTPPLSVPGGLSTNTRRWGWAREQAATTAARLNAEHDAWAATA